MSRQLNLSVTAGVPVLLVRVYDDAKRFVPAVCVMTDRWVVQFDNGDPSSGGLNLEFYAPGYRPLPFTCRMTMPPDNTQAEGGVAIELEPTTLPFKFPPDVKNAPLPPFDPSDAGGDVHTTLPPDALTLWVPPHVQRDVWRMDFAGVTTPETPPFIAGANSSPPNMWLTFFLHRYAGMVTDGGHDCIDYFLDFYVNQRGYTHILLSPPDDPSQLVAQVAFFQRVARVVPFIAYWDSGNQSPVWDGSIAPFLQALIDAGLASQLIFIYGKEIDSFLQPPNADANLEQLCALCNPHGIQIYTHFNANYRLEYNLITWANFIGRVAGVCWQGNVDDSAGKQGAMLWYVRRYLGPISPTFKVVAFELTATNELYGKCDELHGCLRGYEMVCCTSDGSAPPVAGFGNAARYPDGSIL